jgi:hypothetical protein
MGVIKTVNITKFYGGVSDDVRQQDDGVFHMVRHFDIYSNPLQLTPELTRVADMGIVGTSSTTLTYAFNNFAVYRTSLYAIGRTAASANKLQIFYKDGTANILNDNQWTIAASSSQAGVGTPMRSAFVPFKDYLWGIKGSSTGTTYRAEVWRYGSLLSGTKALTESYSSTNSLVTIDATPQYAAPGIVGLNNDNLYLPYENKIAKIDGSTLALTAAKLTLPSDARITALTHFGNTLAIATRSINAYGGKSYVYLWDYISLDYNEVIDWGEGDLLALGTIDGTLVGVQQANFAGAKSTFVKAWSGGAVRTIKRLPYYMVTAVPQEGLVTGYYKNSFVFPIYETSSLNLWAVGKTAEGYPLAISSPLLIDPSVSVASITGLIFLGETTFVAYDSGKVSRTDISGATYTNTSFYISQKFNGGDMSKQKILRSVALAYQGIPTGGAVYLDYRADNDANTITNAAGWTQIFTDATAQSVSHEAMNIESTGTPLPQFKEIQFRIRSTGGTKITGLKFRFEEIATQINN